MGYQLCAFSVQTPLLASRDRQRFGSTFLIKSGSDLAGRTDWVTAHFVQSAARCVSRNSSQTCGREREMPGAFAGVQPRVFASFSIMAGSSETSASAQIFNRVLRSVVHQEEERVARRYISSAYWPGSQNQGLSASKHAKETFWPAMPLGVRPAVFANGCDIKRILAGDECALPGTELRSYRAALRPTIVLATNRGGATSVSPLG